jgi:hypothetical protein
METIQSILFKRALFEEGIPLRKYRTDHGKPKNYNNGKEYNFVFPKSFLNEIEKIDKTKTLDYVFLGTIRGKHREFLKSWDKPNSLILTADQNKFIHPRNDPLKYYGENFFNKKYFEQLSSSKFTLCPAGCSAFDDKYKSKNIFLWSYRFWEAVLCMSIPITNEPDPFWHKDYKFYKLEDDHKYNEDWAIHNFNILKEKHFIWIND